MCFKTRRVRTRDFTVKVIDNNLNKDRNLGQQKEQLREKRKKSCLSDLVILGTLYVSLVDGKSIESLI